MLTKAQIDKYKTIYLAEYGREISDEDALKQCEALVNLVRVVAYDNDDQQAPPHHSITSNSGTTI